MTISTEEHNPAPEGTEGELQNIRDEAAWLSYLASLKTVLPGERVSKHRKGRTPKLTAKQRAKRDRAQRRLVQARKTHAVDAATFRQISDEVNEAVFEAVLDGAFDMPSRL